MRSSNLTALTVLLLIGVFVEAVQDDHIQHSSHTSKSTSTFSGSSLPKDWSKVSIVDGTEAIISYKDGRIKNSPLSELNEEERSLLSRLQNQHGGSLHSNPLSDANQRLSQWSSSASSSMSDFAKNIRGQFDSLVNKNKGTLDGSIITN